MAIRYLSGINVDSNTLFVDSTNNRVGIGTDSPSRQLELVGSDAYIQLTRSSASTQATLGFNTGATNDWLIRTGDGSTSNLQFYSYGTSSYVMTIARSSGNVGIGTTAPSSILHVDGTDPYVRINNVNSANNQGIKISYNYSDTHGFHLSYNANVAGAYIDNTYPITSGQAWGDIYFRQNSAGTMVTRMTIKADGGNVGIGTTSPAAVAGYVAETIDGTNGSFTEYRQNGTALFRIGADSSRPFLYGMTSAHMDFYTTTAQRMRITNDGNILLGTNQSYTRLTVSNGNNTRTGVTLSDADTSSLMLFAGASTIASINFDTYGLRFMGGSTAGVDNGTEIMRFTTSYNVGIGTTSPGFKLTVVGGNGNQLGLDNAGERFTQLSFLESGSQNSAIWLDGTDNMFDIYANTSHGIRLKTGGDNTRLTVASGGNVLINTTTDAGYKLDVNGTGRFTAALAADSNIDLTGDLRYQSNAGFGIKSLNGTRILEVYNTGINFPVAITGTSAVFSSTLTVGSPFTIKATNPYIQWQDAAGTRLGYIQHATNLVMSADTGAISLATTSGQLWISSAGNVGIGIQNPSYLLDVNGSINARSNSQVSGNAQVFTIDGTNHAYYAWSVAGSRKAYAGFGSSGSTTFELINENTGGFIIGTNGSQQLIITSAGNVGIGTTSPTTKLHTVGNIRSANAGNTVYSELQNDGVYAFGTDLYLLAPASKFVSIYAGNAERMRIASTGATRLNAYGSGSITGTVAYNLAVDSSGNIIETAGGVVDGSGTANYVTKWQDANTVTNSQIFDNGTNVGINNATPKTKLDINGAIGFGSKTMSMTDTFAAALTLNMNDHNGCYVKITAFGDWSNHSTIAYLGEFFIQASAGAYNEPGIIIRQVDNTGGGDDIQAQILDPAGAGTRDFIIELKATSASNTPFTAYIQYEVRGMYNSVS